LDKCHPQRIAEFVDAGLTPYEAIEAATRNPGEYFAEVMKVAEITKGTK